MFIKSIICDETKGVNFIYSSLSKYKNLASEKNLLLMEKDIENVNKHIKENPSKFVEVNNRNITNFNSVQSKRGGGHLELHINSYGACVPENVCVYPNSFSSICVYQM